MLQPKGSWRRQSSPFPLLAEKEQQSLTPRSKQHDNFVVHQHRYKARLALFLAAVNPCIKSKTAVAVAHAGPAEEEEGDKDPSRLALTGERDDEPAAGTQQVVAAGERRQIVRLAVAHEDEEEE